MHDKQMTRASNVVRACTEPTYPQFKSYGAKGVTVYEPWITDLRAFAAYIRTLDGHNDKTMWMTRLDDSRGYEPGNIGFIRRGQRGLPKPSSERPELSEAEYEAYMLQQATGLSSRKLAKTLGVSYRTVLNRINKAEAKILRTCDVKPEDSPESRDEDSKSDEQGPGG